MSERKADVIEELLTVLPEDLAKKQGYIQAYDDILRTEWSEV